MRIAARFKKGEQVRFVSHLDVQRMFQRSFRRAGIPVAYSQGFNPHPLTSFATALSVGCSSDAEWIDVKLDRDMSLTEFSMKLNSALPNGFFGTHNPYTTRVFGDWLDGHVRAHTGEVFLNGKSLYEKETLDEVLNPEFFNLSWEREFTKHTWYTEQSTEAEETLIYANFQGKNPNEELV